MSSQVSPPQVSHTQASHSQVLADLSGLAQLAADPTLDMRPVLLRVQTDLFAAAPARDRATVEAYEALALGLLPIVEDEVVAAVARRLAPLPEAPMRVLSAFLRRGGEARAAVIALSPALPPEIDPDRLVLRGGVDALALAARADLSPARIAALLDRTDPTLDRALASSPHPLPDDALARLTDRARRRPDLATLLLGRSDLSLADEAALYLHATPDRRETIVARLGASALHAPIPPRAAPSLAEDLAACLKARGLSGFETCLAASLGSGGALPLQQDGTNVPDLLALTLTAAGLADDQIVRLFLLRGDEVSRSAPEVFRLAALVRATPRPVAIRLVEAILGHRLGLTPAGARHAPYLAPQTLPARTSERREAATGRERQAG
ncbi:MAG TPA: hypothetical protein VIL65_10415 [Beijerinckiaceae bacterium]|jgi:uncharacterized protein (DUF2336 family)